ncbi:L,D-transpeptidase [Nitrosomonas marina]|uniref:L,D-transpeptidase catalytic domain n=1 Tax=Nitrosomonas marina TaxID=917 RepID=A0A1H8HDG9_9PROT|nr:L,D-transpeptidase [Nitrosomonas marina]SEN54160.1 L,D-transpeptidase catalytic domain [Nitrosomonas marina]
MHTPGFLSKVLGLFFFFLLACGAKASDVWIDVNTIDHTLTVMQGDKIQEVFENIAIGRFGTTWHKVTKDDKTPLGDFRIGWINEKSQYYRFFGLDYPDRETARRAFEENRIDQDTWLTILKATNQERTPPQNTVLGGYIGIHGIGRGDPEVHDQFHWTNGCIALTNEQIDLLGKWLKPGVMVKIR